jgi:hypothetical protein
MAYAAHQRNFAPYFGDKACTKSNPVANKAGVLRRNVGRPVQIGMGIH